MKKASNWLWLGAFVALWCVLRVFWLNSDGGVPSIWEYGYFVTDEGYYMGAAKDMFLRGEFCDITAGESFTYGYSPLTHWLAYLGYRLFGLTDWGWRVPFAALYLAAWCLSFLYVRRRCGNAAAFLWGAVFSSLPVVVAYERTACNDLAIGALAAIAFCLAAGKGRWRIFAAAAVAGSITLVKPSVWVLLPLVAAGVLSERKTRSHWLDVCLFAVAAVAAVFAWRALAVLSLYPEAPKHGLSASELIRRTTTHNALPSLFDFDQLFRGFSSFPRDICFKALGPAAAFVSVVPLAMAARDALRSRWSWRILMYLAIPAYVAGVSVNNSICLHYYHPALMTLPLLFAEIARDFNDETPERAAAKSQTMALFFGAAVAVMAALAAMASPPQREIAAKAFSTISNLPQGLVWKSNAAYGIVVALGLVVLLAVMRGLRALAREGAVWLLLALVGASVAFAGVPGLRLAQYLKQTDAEWFAPIAVSLLSSAVFLVLAFGLRATVFRKRVFMAFAPAVFAVAFAFIPTWRNGVVELLRPGSRLQREVAKEIAGLLPEGAVVIGERSRQVLMGQPFRTATTMPGCDPIPIVRRLLAADPEAKLFALADSQNAYNLQHFREHAREYRLDLVREFKLPSFANGQPASVYLCRIVQLPSAQGQK